MEENPAAESQLQPQPQPQTQMQSSHKPFFESLIGRTILGLTLVIVLVVILAWLNYFGVLSLPKQFDFLPKRVTNQFIANINTSLDKGEDKQLRSTVQAFINDNLQPQYAKKVDLKEDTSNKTLLFPLFTDSWQERSVSAKVTAQYDFKYRRLFNINLSIVIPHSPDPVTSSNVDSIIAPYLKLNEESQFSCEEPNQAGSTFCYSMITNLDSKLGISLISSSNPNNPNIIIVCQLYPGSASFNNKSCLAI